MIKKITLMLLVLTIGTTLHGQTLEETKDWIKEKLETFYFTEPDFPNDLTVSFDDENIIFHVKKTAFGTTVESKRTIPIKEMRQIRLSKKESTVWIVFRVKSGADIKIEWFYSKEVNYKKESELIMDKDVLEDNLEERLKKAFESLISNYGGTVEEAY